MVVTVLCAGLTVVFFIISNVNEAQWKFGEEESTTEISSKIHVLEKFLCVIPNRPFPSCCEPRDESEA